MTTLPDPRVSVQPITRHGTCRLYIRIGEKHYGLSPLPGPRPGWVLTRRSRPAGAKYIVHVNEHGHPACSCPDHQQRGAVCKHMGSLIAARLLPAPVAASASAPVIAALPSTARRASRKAVANVA